MNIVNPIYTEKTQCQDCYKCLRECTVKAIKVENGHAQVVPELCILCGHCVQVCPVGAKKVRDDLDRVKQLLALSGNVYASLAPSFVTEFPGVPGEALVEALLALGFRGVSETALGAEEVSRVVADRMRSGERTILFSSACPTAVELLKKYHPDHGRSVTDLYSPLLAHAAMLKKLYGPETEIVFIGPCISKKREADLHPELLAAAITFSDLRTWFDEKSLDPERMRPAAVSGFVPERCHEGALYPIDGGMAATIRERSGLDSGRFMSFSGIGGIRGALEEIDAAGDGPVFIELLACSGGCVNGPRCSTRKGTIRKRAQILRYAGAAPASRLPKPETDIRSRWEMESASRPLPRSEDIREALAKIGKHSPDDELNCGACGYDTCREFAAAFLSRKAEQTMCVSYMRTLAQKKANALLRTMPSGVVIVDEDLTVIECNQSFARMLGGDVPMLYEAKPGLEGAALQKIAPFHDHFRAVMTTGTALLEKDIHVRQTVLHGSIFTIERNRVVGGIFQDVTAPFVQKDRIVSQAENIIRKHLSTVQKIAYLLGENAAESEVMLNAIVQSFGGGE
jgi:iron only hydrogenase large subunit-like protein